MAKKRRPEGWGKEVALEWARAHAGATLPELARAFASEDCRWEHLAYDLFCFRGEDAEFRRELDSLIRSSNRGVGQELETEPGMEDWKIRWARRYLETEDKIEASANVGLSWSTVQTYLRPRHRNHDPQFKDLVSQVESWFLASDEADLRYALRLARETADARTLAWIALERLGRRDRDQWGKNETIRHEGTVEHKHVLELQQAHAMIAERYSKFFAPRALAALPAPPPTVTLPDASVQVGDRVER